jgi:uncharacterized membrane protein YgcG
MALQNPPSEPLVGYTTANLDFAELASGFASQPTDDDLGDGRDVALDHDEIITYPLHPVDPAKIGDFWPTERLVASASGVAYLAYEEMADDPVMVLMLSKGAAGDPAARDRLAGEVDRMDIDTVIARGGLDQDMGRLGGKFRCEDDDPHAVDGAPLSPWVALAFDQTPGAVKEAHRILMEVDLSSHLPLSDPSGPNYRLHWAERFTPGLSRVWPLPWPGRRDRGGWLTLLSSWLLMLLLAATALLIAILIFSEAPDMPPPPPVQCQGDGEGEGEGDGEGEGEGEGGGGEGSEDEGGGGGGDDGGGGDGGGEESLDGTPTPPSRL